ncbi:MAG: bifunctional demethylmenaquinone methyltransferase/2-methoxy-6-polyprenyl-1,4-benzoquinol methylase UbiE [Planctomycetes bacterium]|nr:bifunctional demethylmenaquinone methyltransferase/2-methoxy-6-polyprenyl-1,4-benzoquinol methylase UbiE [Planctomycetota bacterium]
MFAEIAPRYDFLNRMLSFGIDRRWRRRMRRRLALRPGQELLDLCCGTGDVALEFAREGVRVHGADFTQPMLPFARGKADAAGLDLHWTTADAQHLPFEDASFDAVTIAFGIRNVEDPQLGLRECRRVLRPGGQLAVLEFFPIRSRVWGALFRFYFHRVLPLLAKVVRAGRTGAYRYLPESVEAFAQPEEFRGWMEQAGFVAVKDEALTGGVARLVIGQVPEAP